MISELYCTISSATVVEMQQPDQRGVTLSDDYLGHNLVFVVGCPRSGTTWLQRLLATHPSIKTGQESEVFHYVAPLLDRWRRHQATTRGGIGPACYLTEAEYIHTVKSFLLGLLRPMVAALEPGEIFVEKTPTHGRYLREILQLLPQARVINLHRDPRDTVASLLAASRSWGHEWAPRDVRKAASKWLQHVRSVEDARPLFTEGQFLEVTYEQLHADTPRELRRCFDFLGVTSSDELIREAVTANTPDAARKAAGGTVIPLGGEAAKRAGLNQVKEPEGFSRRAKVGSWQEDLNLREKLIVWLALRNHMRTYGYEWPANYTRFEPLLELGLNMRRILGLKKQRRGHAMKLAPEPHEGLRSGQNER